MGDVFAAEHVHLGRKVAVKVPRLDNPNPWFYQQRLLLEARYLARMNHNNVVGVHDLAFTSEGLAYLVMEFLQGQALDEVLCTRPVPALAHSLRVVRETARAIGACHRAGILVGDIKPENIMIVSGPLVGRLGQATEWVKLIDLGGAHSFDPEADRPAAPPAVRMATPAYCAPELLRGEPLGPATDVYALGILTYELLSGEVPFVHPDDETVLRMHLEREPAPLSSVCPSLLPDRTLDRFVRSCLHKDPGQRPGGAIAFLDGLDRALEQDGMALRATGARDSQHAVTVASEPKSPGPTRPLP